MNTDAIISQVKHNCNISDAQFWGFYSPCGLLFRMRDLYRVERNLKPWGKVDQRLIKAWIDKKEYSWEELEDLDFQDIEISGNKFRPFDVTHINSELNRHGLIYGAGYGHMLKPVFLLAELSEEFVHGNYRVSIAGRELARGLSSTPAVIQGDRILAKHQTMGMFFWDKFVEMKAMKCSGALYNAFSAYGIDKGMGNSRVTPRLERLMERVVREETVTFIHHEVGEASQRRYLGRWWKKLIVENPHSRVEIYLRALKDILSDTCKKGMLTHIIQNRKAGSLGFYVALLSGFRRIIFPEMSGAYDDFLKTGDWGHIEKVRVRGYRNTMEQVRRLKDLYDRGTLTEADIEKDFIANV